MSMFSFASLYHDSASPFLRQNILGFAAQKLSLGAGTEGRPFTKDAALAVLAVRCLLEFNGPTAATSRIPERLVEAHMRIAYAFPESRNYVWSGYSSEPVLAEAAGRLMQDHEEPILDHLKVAISEGLVLDKGEAGELAIRILLMLAYADALRREEQSADLSKPRSHLPVRLLDFLRSLFSDDVYTELCGMQDGAFEANFTNAYVLFSHFVRVSDDSMFTPAGAAALLARGIAVLCKPKQHSIDMLIPIVFGRNTPLVPKNISFLGLQGKNQKVIAPMTFMDDFHTEMLENGFAFRTAIYLQLDVGVKECSFKEESRPSRRSPRHLPSRPGGYYYARIGGCDRHAYSALDGSSREKVFGTLLRKNAIFTDHVRAHDEAARRVITNLNPNWNSRSFVWWRKMVVKTSTKR
jgi:hypothetical protein